MRVRLLVLLCCAAYSLPAQAIFSDGEARKQIADLRAELTRTAEALRQRLDGAAKNQIDFANQIETLRADLARLTGQIEVLTHSLEAAHKRQQDFYVDLDNRLRKLEAASVAAVPQEPPAPKPDPQAEMRNYEAALELFRSGSYKEAQTAFERFIALYPKAALLPNAHYWLGASLYQLRQYDMAAQIYAGLAAAWPNDPKAPDALLAYANTQIAQKDVKAAIQTLQFLIDTYPTSAAAETARSRIKTLAPKKR